MAAAGAAGGYLATIPAADVTPDGIDYFLKAGSASTYEPRMASTGSVVNAVAVFMPEVGGAAPVAPAPAAPRGGPLPSVRVEATASTRLPATGGASWAFVGAVVLLAGLGLRRLARHPAP
jgi:hypothetical protein